MEEARQHPALTSEQRLFAAVFFAGPLSLVLGILMTVAGFRWAIVIAVVFQAASRLTTAIWGIGRPAAQIPPPRSAMRSGLSAFAWVLIAAMVCWSELKR